MLQTLYRFVIPSALLTDPVTRSQAESLVAAGAVAAVVVVPVIGVFGWLVGPLTAACVALDALALLLAVWSMRWLQRIDVARWGTMTATLTMFVIGTWAWGGDPSMGIYQWFALAPMLAAYIGGLRFGLTWMGLSLFTASALAFAHLQGWMPPSQVHQPKVLGGVMNLLFIVTMASLSSLLQMSKEAAAKQLRDMARADLLTGLPNRRHLDERLSRAMARTRRQHRPFALLFLDLDHFKTINDSHGHAAGDAVLQAFAGRLRKAVRETDTVARLAGDEFVILLEGLTDAAHESRRVATAVQAAMTVPIELRPGLAVTASTSIGIACYAGEPVTAARLLAQADAALYRVKAQRRGGFQLAEGRERGAEPIPPGPAERPQQEALT